MVAYGREGQVHLLHFSSLPPLIVIHLVNVGILEDEIDDGEEKAVGGEEEHQQPVGSAGRLAELKRRMMSRWMRPHFSKEVSASAAFPPTDI